MARPIPMARGGAALSFSHFSVSIDAATINSGLGMAAIIMAPGFIPPDGGPPPGNPPPPPGVGKGMSPSSISGSPNGFSPGCASIGGPPGNAPPAPGSGIFTSVKDTMNSPVNEAIASLIDKPPSSGIGSLSLISSPNSGIISFSANSINLDRSMANPRASMASAGAKFKIPSENPPFP